MLHTAWFRSLLALPWDCSLRLWWFTHLERSGARCSLSDLSIDLPLYIRRIVSLHVIPDDYTWYIPFALFYLIWLAVVLHLSRSLSDFLCDDPLFVSVVERVLMSLLATLIRGYVSALVLLMSGLVY